MICKRMICSLISAVLLANYADIRTFADENSLPAFPGAEGGGMYTLGARAADKFEIYHVTNLNDSGEGSFRDAVSRGNRIVVFDISGNIMLKSVLRIMDVDNITILGQTAPGEGICIGGESTLFENCSNIIIRYMRFRPGDLGTSQEDALGLKQCTDVIVDHCSATWSVDEALSAYANRNFTAQYCLISNSLNMSVHDKGPHGYGGIWGGENASFHHNLMSTHYSRMPRIGTSVTVRSYNGDPDSDSLIDIRNNVFYNWGNAVGYGGENYPRVNFINNYYKNGPASEKTYFYNSWMNTVVYAEGNVMEVSRTMTEDNYAGIQGNPITAESISSGVTVDGKTIRPNDEYIYDYPVNTQTAEEAYETVLEEVGASYFRDDIDREIINDVINRTAPEGSKGSHGLIDSQNDTGGWVYLETAVTADADRDGIPDEWEDANGMDKNNAEDAAFIASNGYTNIENYANAKVGKKITVNDTDTVKLRQSLFAAAALNRNYFYNDGMDALDESIENGRAALNGTQDQADAARERIEESMSALKPRYIERLRDYIAEINYEDEKKYLPYEWKQFTESVKKASADLEGAEDNELFRQDYEELTEMYSGFADTAMSELNERLDFLRGILVTKYEYTKETLERAAAAIEHVESSLDRPGVTDDEVIELWNSTYGIEEKINYSLAQECIKLLDSGILRRDKLSTEDRARIAALKAECEQTGAMKFETNDQLNAMREKVLKAAAALDTVSSREYLYLQDFESELPQAGAGSYTVGEGKDGRYIIAGNGLTLLADTELYADKNVYYSVDFGNAGDRSRIIGMEFDGKYRAELFCDYGSFEFVLSDPAEKRIYDREYLFSEKVYYDREGMNNVVMNYDPSEKRLYVYFNNCLVNSAVVPPDTEKITAFGLTESELWQDGSCYTDNIAVFTFGGPEEGFTFGDANADDVLTAADSAEILQKALNSSYKMPIENRTDDFEKYCDVNADGRITAADSAEVLQKVLNGRYKMPVE